MLEEGVEARRRMVEWLVCACRGCTLGRWRGMPWFKAKQGVSGAAAARCGGRELGVKARFRFPLGCPSHVLV